MSTEEREVHEAFDQAQEATWKARSRSSALFLGVVGCVLFECGDTTLAMVDWTVAALLLFVSFGKSQKRGSVKQ